MVGEKDTVGENRVFHEARTELLDDQSAYPPYKGGPLASMALSTENGATPSLAETLILVPAVGLVRLHIQIDGREDCCSISR
jgi:hypothetical protein